eukprot:34740-Eustigmatos_ZCMA.PRE.1
MCEAALSDGLHIVDAGGVGHAKELDDDVGGGWAHAVGARPIPLPEPPDDILDQMFIVVVQPRQTQVERHATEM